jgi:uncharacterized protein (DUF305 family)
MKLSSQLLSVPFILAAACSSESETQAPSPPAIPASSLSYIDGMVPHHQGAIDMANEEVERGASPNVMAMAMMMIDKQQQEIELLEGIREQMAGSPDVAPVDDPHMATDMAELQSLSGADLDVAFLNNMIPHHASAVVMSHRALPNLDRSDLVDFAHQTIDSQTDEMKKMLDMKHELAPAD